MLGSHKDDNGHRWQIITAVIMKILSISMEQFDTESQYLESHILLFASLGSLTEIQDLMGGAGSAKCHIYQYGELYREKEGPRAYSYRTQNNLEPEKGSKNNGHRIMDK